MDEHNEPFLQNEPLIVSAGGGIANTAFAFRSEPITDWGQLVAVFVVFSATASVSVDISLDSALGATYDARLTRVTTVADTTVWWLPEKDLRLAKNDRILVEVPALGATVTATVAVYVDSGRVRYEGLENLLLPWLNRVR